jgi:hypothetical protein
MYHTLTLLPKTAFSVQGPPPRSLIFRDVL